jgi:phosphoglucomutase
MRCSGTTPPISARRRDGDGDRNMVVGRGIYVSPSDSLAVLAANAHLAPGYARGPEGRGAVDAHLGRRGPGGRGAGHPESYETPTGWKFFGNLLDAGRATICGEESFGTGSDHVREKDGLWAVLCGSTSWPCANNRGRDPAEHWARFGRNYYSRHDFEAIEVAKADAMMPRCAPPCRGCRAAR